MKSVRDVEQFVAGTDVDLDADKDWQVLSDILKAHEQAERRRPSRRRARRIVTKDRTGLVAAAAVAVVIALSIAVFERLTQPAWAVEQTIEAIERFEAVYGAGIFSLDGKTEVQAECWARPNRDGTRSGDMRIQTESGYCVVVNEARNTTHTHDPIRNTVTLQDGDGLYCRPWVNGDYFRRMKNACEQWHEEYVKDASTGRRHVIVKARNLHDGQSYEFHFDLQTKLPLRGAVWHNADFAGKPYFDIQEIIYNPDLPDGIFDFQIPAGATIVDEKSE